MKITLKRVEFLSVLQKADKIRTPSAKTPIEFHVTVAGKKLVLRSVDDCHNMLIEMPVETDDSMTFLFPIDQGISAVSKLDHDDLSLDYADGMLLMTSGKAKVKLPTTDITAYPMFEQKPCEELFTVKAEEFSKMVQMCLCSVGSPDRPTLHAINISNDKALGLCMASTDTRRLTVCYGPKVSKEMPDGATVPIGIISKLNKLFSGDLQVLCGKEMIHFKFGGISCQVNLVNEKYVNFQRVVPNQLQNSCTVSKLVLTKAVDLAMVTLDKVRPAISIGFDANRMLVSSVGKGSGFTSNEVDCKYAGKKMDVSFMPNLVMDMLKVVPGDELAVEFNDGKSPFLFRSLDSTYKYICMPFML